MFTVHFNVFKVCSVVLVSSVWVSFTADSQHEPGSEYSTAHVTTFDNVCRDLQMWNERLEAVQ